MAIQTVETLRALVVDVVKVEQNTDPTKTQGIRLRALLSDILDTVQDLVDSLGLSVSSDMRIIENQQIAQIDTIQSRVNANTVIVESLPNAIDIVLKSQLPDFTSFAKKVDLFSKQYTDILNKPDLSVYQLKSDVVTYNLAPYQLTASAFNGDYNNLINKPIMFDGSWTSLTNKPILFSGSYTNLSNIPTTFAPSLHNHTVADITGLQTTLNTIPKVYNSVGLITQNIKQWVGIVTPTTGSGYSISIASAAFTTITGIQITTEANATTAITVPLVSIKSYTTTAVVVNILVSNNGLPVVGTALPGLVFATTLTGVKLHIQVTGY